MSKKVINNNNNLSKELKSSCSSSSSSSSSSSCTTTSASCDFSNTSGYFSSDGRRPNNLSNNKSIINYSKIKLQSDFKNKSKSKALTRTMSNSLLDLSINTTSTTNNSDNYNNCNINSSDNELNYCPDTKTVQRIGSDCSVFNGCNTSSIKVRAYLDTYFKYLKHYTIDDLNQA